MSCSNTARPGTFVRDRIQPITKPKTIAMIVATTRHEHGVPEDVGVPPEVREVVEAVRLRRAGLRIAHAQRGLEQEDDRIQDEDGGGAPDQQADEPRPGQPDRARQERGHAAALRAP